MLRLQATGAVELRGSGLAWHKERSSEGHLQESKGIYSNILMYMYTIYILGETCQSTLFPLTPIKPQKTQQIHTRGNSAGHQELCRGWELGLLNYFDNHPRLKRTR